MSLYTGNLPSNVKTTSNNDLKWENGQILPLNLWINPVVQRLPPSFKLGITEKRHSY